MSSVQYTRSAGRIDESGFLKGLYRKGFTLKKALAELVANCLDADAKHIHIQIRRDYVRISDNGCGMTGDGIENMFAMHRENHAGRARRGVSGVGKSSYVLLSKQLPMQVFTCARGSVSYLCADVPWDRMYADGRYNNMITIRHMTEEEKTLFVQEHPETYGTTIVFPYSDDLRNVILKNYPKQIEDEDDEEDTMDRLGVIFGNDLFLAVCDDFEHGAQTLPLYNYFGDDDAQYICGKGEYLISYYKNTGGARDRFILEGRVRVEIVPYGRGFAKSPGRMVENLDGWELMGQFTVRVGLRRDACPFNEENPAIITSEDYIGSYDRAYIGEKSMKYRCANKVVRNGQRIGYFDTPDFNTGSARGNPESNYTHRLVQVELCYNPTSEQDNEQDRLIGVQENKNQYNGDHLPLTLTRLIKFCREQKSKEILAYIDTKIREARADESESESESESDNDSEDDDASNVAHTATPPVTEVTHSVTPSAPIPVSQQHNLSAEDPHGGNTVQEAPPTGAHLIDFITSRISRDTILTGPWCEFYASALHKLM